MKKIKHKFIYFLIFGITSVIGAVFYLGFVVQSIDRSSYAELVSGKGFINDTMLFVGEKHKITLADEIKTKGKDSMIIIEWGDGSITRLGADTKIQINENNFSADRTSMQVVFKIFSGKTWSNVLTYVPGESYFKQAFDDTEIAVRGTVYTVDLEKEYIYVENHKVNVISSNGDIQEVKEKEAVSTKDLGIISLKDFILHVKDKVFFSKNKALDQELFLFLKRKLQKQLQKLEPLKNIDISKLGTKEIETIYNELLSAYQNLNFISTKSGQALFNLKISFKEKLIALAPSSEKKNLAQSFFYDFQDMVNNKRFYSFDKVTKVLITYKKYFEFSEFLELLQSLQIQKYLEEAVKEDLERLKDTFNVGVKIGEKVVEEVSNIEKKAQNKLMQGAKFIEKSKNNLEKQFDNSLDKFGNLIKNSIK